LPPACLVLQDDFSGAASMPAEMDDMWLMAQQVRLEIGYPDSPFLLDCELAAVGRHPQAFPDGTHLFIQSEPVGITRIRCQEQDFDHGDPRLRDGGGMR